MKRLLGSIGFLAVSLMVVSGQTGENLRPLTAVEGEDWVIRWNRSDDFNGDEVNWRMWTKVPEKFLAWSWDNEANTSVADGVLTITLSRGPNPNVGKKNKGVVDERKVLFTSGMLKSYASGTYGYYEARIKGTPLFPGASPAFWIYSKIDDSILAEGEVRYSEVDFVELTQRGDGMEGNERISDHNLHAILSNGEPGAKGRAWRRPNDPRYKEAQANEDPMPFDPRDDFHTYGCRVGKDEIIWYVDGVEVGRKKNEHWHRKMNVALSLGVRTPYVVFKNNRLVPVDEDLGGEFPTAMQVDYVRVWELESEVSGQRTDL